ncbi:MAG: hypothetical protein K1X75_05130 [Leptospirales bacterium]|nr:hypothetical protein [Leptospirales bacterium]
MGADIGQIAALAAALAEAFEREGDLCIAHLQSEAPPQDIALLRPRLAAPVPSVSAATPPSSIDLPANFRCTSCADRMYPVRRYYRQGRRACLVLHHSGPFATQNRMDRSRQFIFGDAAEDELFGRMLAAVGWELADLHYQEFTACHFNAARSTEEDWRTRSERCLSHVFDTVRRERIKLILAVGPAAVLLFGAERAQQLARDPLLSELRWRDQSASTLVLRSPAALVALEKKRSDARQRGDEETRQSLAAEEKTIKAAMLQALRESLTALDAADV